MTTTSRTFDVQLAPDAVLDYLKDFGNAEAWDPGTESCTRNDSGPIVVGSSWHNTSKILGVKAQLTYTLKEIGPGRLVFLGENDRATSTDTITAVANGSGSTITYEAVLEMHGAAKLATPVMKLEFEKLGNDTVKQMTETLNAIASA